MDDELFSRISLEHGFISAEDLDRARHIQRESEQTTGSRRLLGIIMLESGMISSTQLLEILKYIEDDQNFFHF